MTNSKMKEQNHNMITIPVQEFLSGSDIRVDIYVRLADDNFVKVAKAGSKINIFEQLKAYEQGKVEHVYIQRDDYLTYVQQNLSIAGIALEMPNLDIDKKTNVLVRASQSVFSEIAELDLNPETFEHAKLVTQSALALIESKPQLQSILTSFYNISESYFKHSLAIGLISAMIGRTLKWQKRSTIEKLALGGMLSEVGMKELPPQLITKPRGEMSFDEVSLWETHPFRGVQILQRLALIPDDVIACVFEHHENAIGQGFPRRLRDVRMNPLAKVVAVAVQFCELALNKDVTMGYRTPEETVKYIEFTLGQPFNREAFKALKTLVYEGQED